MFKRLSGAFRGSQRHFRRVLGGFMRVPEDLKGTSSLGSYKRSRFLRGISGDFREYQEVPGALERVSVIFKQF